MEMQPIGPLPGQDNVAIVVECGACKGQVFQVAWMAAPVGDPRCDHGFRPLGTREQGGERLTPRYFLECVSCGVQLLAPPEGPDPLTVQGGPNRN